MKTTIATIAAFAALATPSVAADQSVDYAYALCKIIDNTGLVSKPCEVSGWNSAVIATIDMSSGEARDVCPKIAGLMRDKGASFSSAWTLQIKSPYSNGESIAFCKL